MINRVFTYISTLIAAVLMLMGCGPVDDAIQPVLSVSAPSVVADGVESVTFEVLYDGEDVSAKAQIWCSTTNEQLAQPTFTTTEQGNYSFYAIYNGLQSNSVEVVATEAVEQGPHTSRFERHVCLIDLTGTGCAFCPKGYRNIVLNITNNFIYSDFVHIMSFHDPASKLDNVVDPMAIDVTSQLIDDYKVSGTPWYIVDLRDGGSLTDNAGQMTDYVDISTEEYPAHCDAAIKTTLNKDSGVCQVEVKVFAETADDYRLALFVVEDNVKGRQLDGSITHEDYNHRHVVRQMLSGSYKGDNLGTIKAEQEVTNSYEFQVGDWNVEQMTVCALVIDGTQTVNNVAECKVNNDEVDYKYIEE